MDATSLFDTGIERYRAGEPPSELIPLFQEVCASTPKNSAAYSCLAWLYLLEDKGEPAYKAAQKAVKLDPGAAQARVNLAIAMLETSKKGVREQIEAAQQLIAAVAEFREQVQENLEDGLQRKPDWPSLVRVQKWLFPG